MEKFLNIETGVSLTTVLHIMSERIKWPGLCLRIHGELGGRGNSVRGSQR